MTTSQSIANNVYYLASKNEMNLGDVERAVGLSVGYFSRVRNGKGRITADNAYALTQLFKVPFEDLYTDLRFNELEKEALEMGYRLVPVEEEWPEETGGQNE